MEFRITAVLAFQAVDPMGLLQKMEHATEAVQVPVSVPSEMLVQADIGDSINCREARALAYTPLHVHVN